MKRQTRAFQTRQQLINAARRVFSTKGFEQARLEDISAAAGKTRGAFYDHFKDKEDVFFAIFEEDLSHYHKHVSRELEQTSTAEERVEALTRHLLHILQDKRRILLNLEFKLYAIRHPRKKKLAMLRFSMCIQGVKATVEEMVPEWKDRTDEERRMHNAQFGAILEGLLLNRLFDPDALDQKQTSRFIRSFVQGMMTPA